MPKMHTHYDNLKVARSAPSNVIRAAYKVLSQQYHPDRNPGSADAARIMTVINMAYAVLSDPAKRNEYDRFLKVEEDELFEAELMRRQESQAPGNAKAQNPPPKSPAPSEHARAASADTENFIAPSKPMDWSDCYFPALLAVIGLGVVFINYSSTRPDSALATPVIQVSTPSALAASVVQKPAPAEIVELVLPTPVPNTLRSMPSAPSGATWPESTGYVSWAPRLKLYGHAAITVDNTQNQFDALVKVYMLEQPAPVALRTIYLKAGTWFGIKNLPAGRYDIRYKNLHSGEINGVSPFVLVDGDANGTVRASDIRLALYDYVKSGPKPFKPVQLDDF